jgi:hypothetical protein
MTSERLWRREDLVERIPCTLEKLIRVHAGGALVVNWCPFQSESCGVVLVGREDWRLIVGDVGCSVSGVVD